jgi:ribosome biogenesis GTPase / thiamine phosphate phosphatase
MNTVTLEALVLANFGRSALLAGAGGKSHCRLAGRKLSVVCGDRVTFGLHDGSDRPIVTAVLPRRNLLERVDQRGRPEAVAANVDRLAITIAPQPAPDWFVVDRYWAAARLADIAAVFVINKTDLDATPIAAELDCLRVLRVPCVEVAAVNGTGIESLRNLLAGSTTLLVGQSGMGKSSIVNALVVDAAAQTAELTRDEEGRHTTTTARWYQIDSDTAIIDAPGVRDFAPPARSLRAAQYGFAEIYDASVNCRFSDCRHFDEPGCAVRAAVAANKIWPRRYESYRRLARLYEGFADTRYR